MGSSCSIFTSPAVYIILPFNIGEDTRKQNNLQFIMLFIQALYIRVCFLDELPLHHFWETKENFILLFKKKVELSIIVTDVCVCLVLKKSQS